MAQIAQVVVTVMAAQAAPAAAALTAEQKQQTATGPDWQPVTAEQPSKPYDVFSSRMSGNYVYIREHIGGGKYRRVASMRPAVFNAEVEQAIIACQPTNDAPWTSLIPAFNSSLVKNRWALTVKNT